MGTTDFLCYRSDVAWNEGKGGPVIQHFPKFLQMAGGYYCSAAGLLLLTDAVTNGTVAYRIFDGGATCIGMNNTTMPLGLSGPFALQMLETMT